MRLDSGHEKFSTPISELSASGRSFWLHFGEVYIVCYLMTGESSRASPEEGVDAKLKHFHFAAIDIFCFDFSRAMTYVPYWY